MTAGPLDPCVHCGFCLPACPTYLATGDEADSPRGRIVLMRALERGEMGSDDAALAQHLDACLGCRGCEPVCPSGVAYGRGLEQARERLFHDRGLSPLARAVLGVFRQEWLWRPLFRLARMVRATGIPRMLAGGGRVGFAMGMLAASRRVSERRGQDPSVAALPRDDIPRPTVALFRGCVMDTLFDHVNDATRRTLEVNGYRVVEVAGQTCCGALHEHAGDRRAAEALARRNVAVLEDAAEYIVVNSAGCGALLKDYGHLLGDQAAERTAAKVRDVSELLAAAGPRPGGRLELDVAYDAPCHLQHAQRVQDQPLAVLAAIPGLRLRLLPGSDKCCGSAGIYSMLRPDMARAVLQDKIDAFAAATPRPQVVATGNPGCLMQIGAGLRAAGLDIAVAHPVELLDESYRRGGVYGTG
ncbi:MAG: 4Fe-4S dicluster domain-containing protein [Gemmatimonadales bacterium]|nr:4Fe-4S dicluster domain-containing protein [Gemmatimonadales bacterium]